MINPLSSITNNNFFLVSLDIEALYPNMIHEDILAMFDSLNLTVEENLSNSHQLLWKSFTDDIIKYISDTRHNIVFLLMGNNAIQKKYLIQNIIYYYFTSYYLILL